MNAKENKPLVSFILTYYNLPVQMLCECIDSILALSLRPFEREIIVVDDGSENSPMNGLMQYGNDIVYVRQKNQGVSVARNTGMQMAKGEYIQFVDGDDKLISENYEQCIDVVRYNNDAEVVVFDFTNNDKEKTAVCEFAKMSGKSMLREQNIHGSSWCYLFKQSVRSALEFTPGRKYAEDEEFVAQLLLRAEVIYSTHKPAYYYREYELSAVHKKDSESIQKRLNDGYEVILHLFEISDRQPVTDRQALQRRIAQLSMDYIYNIIIYTRSREELDKRIEELQKEGLFPLPDRDYTEKYKWFCKLVNTSMGRTVLLKTLPLMKKER